MKSNINLVICGTSRQFKDFCSNLKKNNSEIAMNFTINKAAIGDHIYYLINKPEDCLGFRCVNFIYYGTAYERPDIGMFQQMEISRNLGCV